MTWLRSLFGAPKPEKTAPRPKQKSVLPPSQRAALLRQAMAAHRAGRSHVRGVLEAQLNELRAKVPKPGRDPEGTERLLALHQAHGAVKRLMTHDLRRFLVLVGIRELMAEPATEARPPRTDPKR